MLLAAGVALGAGLPEGQVQFAHDAWRASFTSTGSGPAVALSGGKEPATMAAGDYKLNQFTELGPADAQGRRASLVMIASQPVTVAQGKVTAIAIGSPLKGAIVVSGQRPELKLSLALTDANGPAVALITKPDGQKAPPPTLRVLDASGKEVYKAGMEYG
jgi:hypothetical protein